MQNKSLIIVVVIILVLLGVGFYFYQKQKSQVFTLPELPSPPTATITPEFTPSTPTEATPTEITSTGVISTGTTSEVTIKITSNGFEPKEVTVNKGTKVIWINEQPNPSWPASAVHPTHEVYPGSSIKKCGTPEQDKIFDSCRGLKKGESWNFVFNEVGEWYYHDHLNPSWTGKIVVK